MLGKTLVSGCCPCCSWATQNHLYGVGCLFIFHLSYCFLFILILQISRGLLRLAAPVQRLEMNELRRSPLHLDKGLFIIRTRGLQDVTKRGQP